MKYCRPSYVLYPSCCTFRKLQYNCVNMNTRALRYPTVWTFDVDAWHFTYICKCYFCIMRTLCIKSHMKCENFISDLGTVNVFLQSLNWTLETGIFEKTSGHGLLTDRHLSLYFVTLSLPRILTPLTVPTCSFPRYIVSPVEIHPKCFCEDNEDGVMTSDD